MSYSTEKNIMLYLTGKQTETDVTVEELEDIAQQYPYFGAAKFLLAKKAQSTNNPGFDDFAQKAVVHFANPYWFHFKLNEEQLMHNESVIFNEIKPGGTVTERAPLTVDAAYKAVADVTNLMVNRQEANDIAHAQEDIENDVTFTPATDTQNNDNKVITGNTRDISLTGAITEHNVGKQASDILNDITYAQLEEDAAKEIENSEGLEEKILAGENENNIETDEIVPAVSLEDVPLDKDDIVPAVLPEDVPLDKDDIVPAVDISSEDIAEVDDIIPAVEQEEETPAETDEAAAVIQDEHPEGPSPHIPGTIEDAIEDEETEDIDEDDAPLAEHGLVSDKISAVLQDQLQEFKKPVANDTPVPIETEPYHTVDYFASQGIKLSLEQQRQDNLGVKVRKFTDWLKQMKRVSPTPADLGIDEAAEHKVQTIAASSNEVKEVVTEAMAEVLAMQGMNDKAIQVYKKLSFLEPTKSAYFAAKIDNLKG